MVILAGTFAALGTVRPARALEPRLEWSFETKGKIYAAPILADLDGDGTVEVVVCVSRERRIICLDKAGELRWDYRIHDAGSDGIQATPSVVDGDGDGFQEVFFVDTGGVVGCLDYRGDLVWRVFTGDQIDYSGPVVADINGDGRVEVVFGADSGTLYCLDDTGTPRWRYQGQGQIRGIPALALDPSSGTHRIYVTFGGGVLACLSSEGDVLWAHAEPRPRGERWSSPAVGDVDGDGKLEVVAATEDFTVIVHDALSGQERWRWKGANAVDRTHSFALADFDQSGRLDIVCGDGSGLGGPGNVYRLRDGQPLWTADAGGGVVQGPAVGDVDGDGQLEVLVCSRSQKLICFAADGREEWSYPSQAGSLTTPALGDIDGDGKVEIVFTSKDRYVRCLTLDGPYVADRLPWPMLNHDAQLSGNAHGARFNAPPARSSVPAGPVLELDCFGPLKTGANIVRYSCANAAHRPRHLEAVAVVCGPDGRRVTQTVSRRFDAHERHQCQFDVEALLPGQYTLALRLVDIGTGCTLAEQRATDDFVPLAWERQYMKAWSARFTQGDGAVADSALRNRGIEAYRMVQLDWRGAEAQLAALVRGSAAKATGTDLDELRRAAAKVHQVLAQMARVEARWRAGLLTPGKRRDFAVVPTTTLIKVFRDEPLVTADAAAFPANIALAGNEFEGVQIVVVPLWKDLKRLRVRVSELQHTTGTATIPPDDVVVHRVGYVEIGPPEYNHFIAKRGLYPDIAFPAEPVDVPATWDAQPFLVTVRARAETPPGDYAGDVAVEADGCESIRVPLRLHVWDFDLPKETRLKTSFWLNEGFLQRFYKYPGRTPFEVRKRFYDYQLDHRAGPLPTLPLGGGEVVEDFEYLLANGQNNLFVSVPGYADVAARAPIAEQLRATRDLVAGKGWQKDALFYARDEVAVMARHEIPQVVEMNRWTRSIVPDWPILETSAPEQALFGAVDIWCPTLDHFNEHVLAQRMAQGDRLWFYTVWGRPGIMIEFPATDARLMFWICWKYGAEGFLYWGTTHWDLNTTTDARWPDIAWIPYNRQPGHNGCGYLIYPGPNGTPIGSLRFEYIRDGIEDYEYLHLLRTRLTAAGDQVPAALRSQAEAELAIGPELVADARHVTEDPQQILAARARVAALIEALAAGH
ncbi:MAG: hypothetical protein A2W31_11795 [Planctomycetes bacterium RBG_16_64_10]|nr:MAG: hypothetical protein A2W31_11795 [Planctomycetes bacterium RBG_16_64_10]